MSKKLLALAFVTIPFLFAFIDPAETGQKSPSAYYISYTKADKSLKADQAKIDFQFTSDYSGLVKDSILMSYNGVSKTLHCDSLGHATLMVKPGKYKFLFWLDFTHKEIYSDSVEIKGAHITGINVWFTNTHYIMEADKPVIYFYPEQSIDVNVTLHVKGELGFTYPKYDAGWNFTADTNGTLHAGGKEYDYLFWDAKIPLSYERITAGRGFYVQRDSLVSFFEEKLTIMGLNAREQQDFITYWCPLMQKNETSFVRFMFNEEYDELATINITPKPDHIFRVFMYWSDGSEVLCNSITPQEIPTMKREGFTVVEWGGGEVSAQPPVGSAQ